MNQRVTRTALLALAVTAAACATTVVPVHAVGTYEGSGTRRAAAATAPDRTQGRGHEAALAVLRQEVAAGGPPGAAAMAQDAEGRWFGSAGFADTGTRRERSADDRFRAGSITKTFIATVLLQLEAEGKLSLDDTVERWLPGVVRGNGNDGRKIRLRQLLNHTSHLPSHTGDPAFQHNASGPGFPAHRYDTHTPEELVSLAMKYRPEPGPDTKPVYSNTNYVVAGMVIEKATGHTYAQEATRRIIEPLNLRGTSFPGTAAAMPDPHPVAYSRLHDESPGAEVIDATEQNMTWVGAAGDLISTTGDLNTFHRALMRGELLPRAQRAEMLDGVPAGAGVTYGLGVESMALSCGVTVVGKTGRANGSLSVMAGTKDGRHQLTFNLNGDWLKDPSFHVKMIEAEFCGKRPAPVGKP